jgi:putative hydrolase of the HAD superfamily
MMLDFSCGVILDLMSIKNNKIAEAKLWIFDADDTLWESALYFRRAEEDFTALMQSMGWNPDEIRAEVHKRDIERLSVTGYGARPYMHTLRSILENRMSPVTPYLADSLDYISNCLLHHPLVLLPGVINTLEKLYLNRKRMIIYTMGEEDHQTDKINRSGISRFFQYCKVVPVKTEETMKEILLYSGLKPEEACMVGNSPRSDINPAIRCGVNALYVKRELTWQAEQTEFTEPELVITVGSLPDILPLAGLV